MEKQPTWAEYTAMQFKYDREMSEMRADRDKYKYALKNYRDKTIDRLEKEVVRLEKEIENIRPNT